MHQGRVIYACYFVKSVCTESALERQAALYSGARNSINFSFLLVLWIKVVLEQSPTNL